MALGGAGAAMAGGQAGAARSRSLFLWDDGRPMRFYLRPGLAKLRLAPLVLAGGGRLCRVQEPGAVLLAEPGEVAPDGAVSTEYVAECVKRNQRLPLEPFLLTARGRLAFTEAEDAALLQAVRGQGTVRVSGRALWIELERRGLTRHSWQAMRDRYLRHLLPRLWEPPQTEDPTQIRGLFAAANREFESTESESDSSDVAELPTQDGLRRSPGETASELKTGPEDSAFPDIQLQRQERPKSTCSSSNVVGQVVKTMEHFMEKFAVDLLTVTQAFLKNSGDVEATSYFLQTGQRLDGYPVWSREDDLELQKDDEHVRNQLIAKFGAENVAKRIVFRES
ncbi:telomeric repeat-binding factor 2-interacting protein 1 [Onychostruthus taczanowskii]|uniref:telomeric repeat-binding factor 2-interacting protein 1 n=1 Tax=Onychostruthus taczanowskii TaxID=356909 RepID=UPI001B80A586|nr:telomeric repeat-binding factor 2-interacting protein 1 [Onychostruthus taczanowskii]